MPTLVVATLASANPMGAQRYEHELRERVPTFLDGWRVRHDEFRSLRSSLTGTRRAPIGWLSRSGVASRAAAGRLLFPDTRTTVHRTDLVLPPGAGGNTVTIHDTIAWRFADESAPIAAAAEEARRADAVICVSNFTANEVHDYLGVKDPVVIANGVEERFFDAPSIDRATRTRLGLEGPYVLHAGGASARKNLEGLAAAWPIIRRRHPELTLALSGPPHPRRTSLFERLPGTRVLGRQPDSLMPGLVAGAHAVIIPSLYEGFGLPALEAMAAGTLVVAADTTALTEVVGDAGVLSAPTGPGLAEAVIGLMSDTSEWDRIRSRGRVRAAAHSWDRTAREHAAVWAALGH